MKPKPHLRLEYCLIPGGTPGIWAHWWRVVLVRGSRRFPHRGYTRWHETSKQALAAADTLFG